MLENHILSQRYKIEALLGHGGKAWVYRAWDTYKECFVAVRYQRAANEQIEWEIQREIRLVQNLEHPNIIRYLDTGVYNNGQYIVMPLLSETASQRYTKAAASSKEVKQRLEAVMPILNALAYLHDHNIVHADIKANNIMFDEHDTPILCDFDTAHQYTQQINGASPLRVTLTHASPEATQNIQLSPTSDLYSLGCFFYEILTGVAPFGNKEQPELAVRHLTEIPYQADRLNTYVSPALGRVLAKLLEKAPRDRYQNIAELNAALHDAFDNPMPRSEALLLDIKELNQQLPAHVWQTLQAASLHHNGVSVEQLSKMLNTETGSITSDITVLLEQDILREHQNYYYFNHDGWRESVETSVSSRRQKRYFRRLGIRDTITPRKSSLSIHLLTDTTHKNIC